MVDYFPKETPFLGKHCWMSLTFGLVTGFVKMAHKSDINMTTKKSGAQYQMSSTGLLMETLINVDIFAKQDEEIQRGK